MCTVAILMAEKKISIFVERSVRWHRGFNRRDWEVVVGLRLYMFTVPLAGLLEF